MQVYITKSFFHLLIFQWSVVKMYARLVIGDWWRWWWWQLIIRGSVVEPAMSLEKLRGPRFWLFSKQSSLYCAAPWPPAESDCYIKDCTRWSVKFFCAIFRLSISDILRNKKDWCSRWVDSCEEKNFSKKKKNKRLLSFKHIISKTKNRSVWGTNFFQMCNLLPRCEKWLQLCWVSQAN